MDNNYFPTARQAYEWTDEGSEKYLSSVYAELKEKIIDAANSGKDYIYYDKFLPHSVVSHLRKLGYDVTVNSQYNEFYYDIDWSEV